MLTAEQETVRAEELSSQGASQVAEAEIRAVQLVRAALNLCTAIPQEKESEFLLRPCTCLLDSM